MLLFKKDNAKLDSYRMRRSEGLPSQILSVGTTAAGKSTINRIFRKVCGPLFFELDALSNCANLFPLCKFFELFQLYRESRQPVSNYGVTVPQNGRSVALTLTLTWVKLGTAREFLHELWISVIPV